MALRFVDYPLPLKLLIVGRSLVASGSLLTPNLFARVFRMEAAGTPAIPMGRMFGIRNALLALGLSRLGAFSAPGTFLKLNVLTDTVDAAVLVAAGRRGELSKVSSTLGTAVALSAVVVGAASLAALPASEA
ncbi:Uncharacterised protein [Mycobacteroides abscessus]|uniref:Uncharacterized protein n=5 Tax=Mycobacteroides abscessus TaxID=36809 RepID=A0A0U0Z319_9MYCO|nr:hypothetical protein [Mycobacteroides abscessus]ESV57238.1 hypothetical protein L830_3069 [Mycobacteroides abscessus MAB_082312_2258]ESV65617.1 hypothetical protein L833_3010 [Mycobacteroides abscessus MAB_091912_2446]AGM31010.1 hypothetical protein MASS_4408 [Mycobacteroides abscessus subsp. bolletii 50594]AIC71223.1 hypothetical protein MYCMA_04110 [Mycobacteroides abscessus subsp. massiliense str. GO 06]AMU28081.1 hypothetical protein A3N96_23930 [Mycobacteroides abscessus]